MTKIIVSDTNLTNIANAIRSKNGKTKSYSIDEMATAISALSAGGGSGTLENVTVTMNSADSNIYFVTSWLTAENGSIGFDYDNHYFVEYSYSRSVLKGSYMHIVAITPLTTDLNVSCTGNIELLGNNSGVLVAKINGEGSITVTEHVSGGSEPSPF